MEANKCEIQKQKEKHSVGIRSHGFHFGCFEIPQNQSTVFVDLYFSDLCVTGDRSSAVVPVSALRPPNCVKTCESFA